MLKRTKLDEFLRKHPKPHEKYSIADIARAIGATRAYMQQCLPGYARERARLLTATRAQILKDFFRDHPAAVQPFGIEGSWRVYEIVRATGVPEHTVRKYLDIHRPPPPRLSQAQIAKRRADAQRRSEALVLRTERCEICRKPFVWTAGMDKRARYEKRTKTCSRGCANQAMSKRDQ